MVNDCGSRREADHRLKETVLAETYRERFETELPQLVREEMTAAGIDYNADNLNAEIEQERIEDDLQTRFEEDQLPDLLERAVQS